MTESSKRATSSSRARKKENILLSAPVVAMAFGLLGSVAGVLMQDRLDVLRTDRELALKYHESLEVSANEVDDAIEAFFDEIRAADGRLASEDVGKLRSAVLDLHNDTERVALQIGTSSDVFEQYATAMNGLLDSAEIVTGAADAKPFVEATSEFYFRKKEFDRFVAAHYRQEPTE
jgi:hypothetical protein